VWKGKSEMAIADLIGFLLGKFLFFLSLLFVCFVYHFQVIYTQ